MFGTLHTASALGVGPVGLTAGHGLLLGESGVSYIEYYFRTVLGLPPPDLGENPGCAVEPADLNQPEKIRLVIGEQRIEVSRNGPEGYLFLARY